MEKLTAEFEAAMAELPPVAGDRVVTAVSGGTDSLVLADLLARTRPAHGLQIVVAHVDHGIHGSSGTVAAAVSRFASERGLAFALRELQLGPQAGETIARARRYAALEDIRRTADGGWIATAHHADDQAETVLMRLLHGSGPAGLAGMEPVRCRILRPLLRFTRAELESYAAARGVYGWRDPANSDLRHERAWLRRAVLPLLNARFADVSERLGSAAKQAADDRGAWDAALDLLPGLDPAPHDSGISVAASPIAGYDSRLSTAAIRAAARRAGIVVGPRGALRALELVRGGTSGSWVPLGGGAKAELSFGRLRLSRGGDERAGEAVLAVETDIAGEASWGRWTVRWTRDRAPERHPRNGMTAWFVPGKEMRVREWRPGDRLLPIGGTGHRLLVRCFQDAQVPRSRRSNWPIVEAEGQVVWAPGVCRAAGLVPEAGSEALRVDVAYA